MEDLKSKVLKYLRPYICVIYGDLIDKFGEDARSVITELEKEGKLKLKLDGDNVNVYHGPLYDTHTRTYIDMNVRYPISDSINDSPYATGTHYSTDGDNSMVLRIGELEFPIESLQYTRDVNTEPLIGSGSVTPYATIQGSVDYSGSFSLSGSSTFGGETIARRIWDPSPDRERVHFDIRVGDTTFRNCVATGIESILDFSTRTPRFNISFMAQNAVHQPPGHIERLVTTMGVGVLGDDISIPTETLTVRWNEF